MYAMDDLVADPERALQILTALKKAKLNNGMHTLSLYDFAMVLRGL
jgi:hypothetical protein